MTEKRRLYLKRYRQKNLAADLLRLQAWKDTHPERSKEASRAATKRWVDDNAGHVRDYKKKWYANRAKRKVLHS